MGLLEGLLAPRQQKAETGLGASMIRSGIPLSGLRDTPQKRAIAALKAYKSSLHIRAAERVIANQIADVPWWLQDQDGNRVTDESPEEQRSVKTLLESPYRPAPGDPITASPRTFDGLRQLTIRHSGIVGYGFWYLVGAEVFGIPLEILYINPARLTPSLDKSGELIGWVLDADAAGKGTPFTTDEIVPFYLEEPDDGFLPDGLVATALAKAEIQRLGDNHIAGVLATGGRIPGIFHPPAGETIPEEAYQGLVRDMRSILEDPNAAKRTMVLKGALEFESTAMTPGDMGVLDIQTMARDDILGLWGVPSSQLGYQRPVGIGETSEDKDAQVMWNNAIGPRLGSFAATLQGVIDRFDLGLDIVFDIPEFDDKATLFDMAQASVSVPMRAVERRELVGLAPFDDPVLDNMIHLPINLVQVAQAPDFDPGDAMLKARLESDTRIVRLKETLAGFLKDQAERVGRRIEEQADHIARKPRDIAVWWSEKRENEALLEAMRPHVVSFAQTGSERAGQRLRGKAIESDVFSDALLARTLRRLGLRITGINATTRDRIRDLILEGLEVDIPPAEVGRGLRGLVEPLPDDVEGNRLRQRLGDFGSELRAETIARTEMRVAQNGAAIDAYQHEGVNQVEMIDGDQDAACAARNGRVVTLEQAESHMAAEHPNGTLDFAPIVNGEAKASASEVLPSATPSTPIVQHIHYPQPEMQVVYTPPPVEIPATNVHVPKPDPVNVEVHTPAPVVNVAPAETTVNVAAPEVKVDAPEMDMAPLKALFEEQAKAKDPQPVFVTNMPGPKTHKVIRDRNGRVERVEQE